MMTEPDAGQEEGTRDRLRLLVTITGGGHKFQASSLAKQLRADHDLIIAATAKWNVEKEAAALQAPVYDIPAVNSFSEKSPFKVAGNLLRAVSAARRIIAQTHPDAVVAVGTNVSIPLFFAARLKGIPCIFVESITRVETWSTTLRILVALHLCSRAMVQWPELADPKRGVLYEGTVL